MSEDTEGEWRVERNVIDGVPVWELWKPSGHLAVYTRDELCVANLEDIADAMNARRWRPIETAPAEPETFDIWVRNEHTGDTYRIADVSRAGDWFEKSRGHQTSAALARELTPLFWQPLPPPPRDAP